MRDYILIVHLLVAIALIVVILLQRSEGGALGIGNATSGSLFSARGIGSTLTRITAFLALSFFITSMVLVLLSRSGNSSLLDRLPAGVTPSESILPRLPGAPPPEPQTPQVPVTP